MSIQAAGSHEYYSAFLKDSPQNVKLTGNRILLHTVIYEEQKKDISCLELLTIARPLLVCTCKNLRMFIKQNSGYLL